MFGAVGFDLADAGGRSSPRSLLETINDSAFKQGFIFFLESDPPAR